MGLDQYLQAKTTVVGGEHIKTSDVYDKVLSAVGSPTVRDTSVPTATVSVQVGYWRKENAIHQWFVDNCQGGEDDCREAYVSRDSLTALKTLCEQVLADNSLARELLPTTDGFFFGSTDYDEWYFAGLRDTVEIVKDLTDTDEYKNWEFYYQSSW